MSTVAPPAAAAAGVADRLRITEIFLSLQGEARDAGWPTVFVRLTGCPLRCTYCDTAYAFHGGEWRGFDEILAEVAQHARVAHGVDEVSPELVAAVRGSIVTVG